MPKNPLAKSFLSIGFLVILSLLLLVLAACRTPAERYASMNLDRLVASIRNDYGLPSLAVSVIEGGETVYREAVGVRREGDPTPVTVDDAYHIGSCTKGMTAALAAMLVQDGTIRWNSTVGEALNGVVPTIDPGFAEVTLEQLLSMTGGIDDVLLDRSAWVAYFTSEASPREQRLDLARRVLASPPAYAPGSAFLYSNHGVAIAGLMLETASGVDWETLVTQRLFEPLGMSSAGFGPPATSGTVDAPWGHAPSPMDPGSLGSDNPPVIAPAGRVHANLRDLEEYIRLFLAGGAYPPDRPLLTPESFDFIRRPRLDNYGLGWLVYAMEPQNPDDYVLAHDGSNTMFYAVLLAYPRDGFGLVLLTNRGDGRTSEAMDVLAQILLARHRDGTLRSMLVP